MCMLGSLGLVAGMVVAPAPALAHDVDPADFQHVTLARGVAEVGEPMAIAVLPDRSVPTRRGPWPATSASRTTATATTCRSATSGSRS
jgi:hypothetical protein